MASEVIELVADVLWRASATWRLEYVSPAVERGRATKLGCAAVRRS